jgi:hypothetical protein
MQTLAISASKYPLRQLTRHIAIKELVRTWGAEVKPLAGGAAPLPLAKCPN